ncbi:MAG: hypothetical protein AAF449_00620 [Myxococcota bacterium]
MRTGPKVGVLTAAAMCAALGACASETTTEIQLDGLEFSYAFLVFFDAEGAVVRTGSVFGRADGESFGDNALRVNDGEQSVMLVTMTEAQLRTAQPGFEASRAREMAVQLEAPPASPVFFETFLGSFRRLGLPSSLQYYRGRLDGTTRTIAELEQLSAPDARALSSVTLLVPVDPEFCGRSEQTPLRPFASVARPFEAAAGTPSQFSIGRDVLWLDDDTLLVVTATQLYVVRQGEDWRVTPQNTLATPSVPEGAPSLLFESAVVAPTSSDGRRTVWVVGGRFGVRDDRGRRNGSGVIWQAERASNEWIGITATATDANAYLWSVARGSRGEVLAGGDNGALWRKAAGVDAFEKLETLPTFERDALPGRDWISAIVASDLSSGPPAVQWIAASMVIMHRFDGAWRREDVGQNIVISAELLEFFGLAGIANDATQEVDLWAAASRGRVYRSLSSGAEWARAPIPYPPRFGPCASAGRDENGRPLANMAFRDVAVDAAFAYLAYQRCSAVIMVDRRGEASTPSAEPRCALMLAEEVDAPNESDRLRIFTTASEFISLAVRANALAALTVDGKLLVSRW